MSKQGKNESSGFLWIVLVVGGVALLFSLITWPFRALIRRLPGRREKELQAEIDESRKDIEAARLLLQVLRPDDPKSSARLEKRIAIAERQIAEVVDARGWPEDLDDHGPGELAVELLEKSGVVSGIDWKAAPDELRKSLNPLLKRQGVSLDWSFVQLIETTGDGQSLRNTNLLPVVGDHVERLGLVLAHVQDGSDNYLFAVCSPDAFSRIDDLTCRSFTIRRPSSATGPAGEP